MPSSVPGPADCIARDLDVTMLGRISLAPMGLLLLLFAGDIVSAGATTGLDALGIPVDNEYVRKGYLPVTLFGARPNDGEDDTAAIQKTVETALEFGYVAFFPPGRYVVSDTIRAMQPSVFDQAKNKARHDRTKANTLVGSTRGERPRLVLADDAAGFDDPANAKPLVWIWAQPRNNRASGKARNLGSVDPNDEQPNISMNQVFKGIDIDIRARGNRGAIGIRHAGSQGSTLEDVTIWAEGAHAGIVNAPGQGGGSYRVRIVGGEYGVWADRRTRFPVMAGVELIGQKVSAVFWDGQSNLTLAGFYIERSAGGSAVTLNAGRKPIHGAVTLVDGVIRTQGGTAIDNTAGSNLYLQNVSVSGAEGVVRSAGRAPIPTLGSWTQVVEYAHGARNSAIVVNGDELATGSELANVVAGAEPDWPALGARHVWDETFPSFEDPDVANAADFGAVPDDGIDDSEAIHRAFAGRDKVFLPKGVFTVDRTLVIPKNKHLFGAAKHLSIIRAEDGWNPSAGTPVVSTVADPSSGTSLSFLGIEASADQSHTAVEWLAGSKSIVRDIMVDLSPRAGGKAKRKSAAATRSETYRISGGGRWYAVAAPWNKMRIISRSPHYRHLRVEGTTQPLAIYGLNVERSLSQPQAEIRDAQNVRIFYLKSETLENAHHVVLSIVNSRNIGVFGYSGIATPLGNDVVSVRDSDDLLFANLTPLRPDSRFSLLSETRDGQTSKVGGERSLVLYRRHLSK